MELKSSNLDGFNNIGPFSGFVSTALPEIYGMIYSSAAYLTLYTYFHWLIRDHVTLHKFKEAR